MLKDLEIRQWDKYEGDDWWKWAVWIEGSDDDLDQVEYVEWTLHPTFSKPIRKVRNRDQRFRLETGGWGTFEIGARVQAKDGNALHLRHDLKLYYPDGTETDA
jgi:transcription initiation factor IIF auxiliary subunit